MARGGPWLPAGGCRGRPAPAPAIVERLHLQPCSPAGLAPIPRTLRSTYLVTYDISNDLRLRKVHQTMRGFGDHLQYSVFECQLSKTDLAQCRHALGQIINHREDQVLFVDLGPVEGRGDRVITAVGRPYSPIDSPCIIVDRDDDGRPAGPRRKENAIRRAREARASLGSGEMS